MLQCFVLGSGGMAPLPGRRLSAVALRLAGSLYLFDCGEGTQVPFKELHLGQRALRLVAVTHLHADHCLGLPGMLMLRAQMPDPGPLAIVGPPGLGRFISDVRRDLAMYINYEIDLHEWSPGGMTDLAYEDENLLLRWAPLDHTVLCLGYRVEERDRPGRFDAAIAEQLGVPPGPARGELQQGREVKSAAGSIVRPEQVLGPARRGRRIAYITDTAPATAIGELIDGADLAFVEGMFLSEHAAEAAERKHLTAGQAAHLAQQAGARRLVLLHISPRYADSDRPRLLEEAALHHPAAQLARDGELFEIPLPD